MSSTKMSSTHGTGRRHDPSSSNAASRCFGDAAEWEAKEALRQRELEEARARAAQMEKTMRWWSDCTANWREKWSKVRTERNKARDEVKILRSKLDSVMQENNACHREKQDLQVQNEQMRKELEKIHLLLLKHAGQWDHQLLEALESADPEKDIVLPSLVTADSGLASSLSQEELIPGGIEEYVLQGAVPKHAVELFGNTACQKDTASGEIFATGGKENALDSDSRLGERSETDSDANIDLNSINELECNSIRSSCNNMDCDSEEVLRQKLSMLQLRLDETSKTLVVEREEKQSLHKTLEKIEMELSEMKEKCEDLKTSKQEAMRELLRLQDTHQDTVALIRADLLDEATSREGMDRRLADLRAQLERLQAENASEWGKRERLETEKLSIERENKKLRAELNDVIERLERKGRPQPTADNELRTLQQELCDKSKELTELKHTHNKLKKILADKTTELGHAFRRAEQYEGEVKKLRSRVEELKRELAVAEDEVDSASNNIRKLQRSNDELQEQVESLQVQLQHLNTSTSAHEDSAPELE
ncbi:coiled-coil domain-containing protein 102A isoform X2 [Bemisia tabaci]|uniref:coiled-coil domain-containing protein 102A isoform X2 n=1 Tax=Bemisia tabaci TaxID=7038 RepID=UPI0008F9AA41|nr:PREDICTED: coiled-coil domain-containing protein 102A-like isoform X2 [Bemisia tabaci]